MKAHLALAALALLAACDSAPPPRTPPPAADTAPRAVSAVTGWLEADGPGETALVYRSQGSAHEFAMSCAGKGAQATLTIATPGGAPDALPAGARGELMLAASAFEGAATSAIEGDTMMWRFTTPVTPALLKALSGADSTLLNVNGVIAAAGPDTEGKFSALAASCAIVTGLEPAL